MSATPPDMIAAAVKTAITMTTSAMRRYPEFTTRPRTEHACIGDSRHSLERRTAIEQIAYPGEPHHARQAAVRKKTGKRLHIGFHEHRQRGSQIIVRRNTQRTAHE